MLEWLISNQQTEANSFRPLHFLKNNMPGLAIILTQADKQSAQRDLQQMVDVMVHEPSYKSDVYCNEELGLFIGWTGHLNAFNGGMPLRNAGGDILVFFNGEHHSDYVRFETEITFIQLSSCWTQMD